MGKRGPEITSTRPRAARRRLRDNVDRLENEILQDIETVFEKPIDEWDWEELSHGRPRGANGTFQGGKPKWITPAITAEAKRRMRVLTEDELMTHARDAIGVLVGLMRNDEVDDFGKPHVPASVKAQCSQYVINQAIGTPTAKMEITTASPLELLMADVLVNPDGQPSHQIIEGSVVEDDEEDGDDE